MQRYNPKDIEPKWQKTWEESGIYMATEDPSKPKKYILEYFPYPSGAAMHVGHVRNYTIGDVLARFNRMAGYNVLHPMGWDGFGLPAENYAIKTGISPRQAIDQNTARFREQLTQMGFSYDWTREIDSTDPKYYKWTQWFFLKLWERGLAYQQESLQWWCPFDKTVLANEQVESGKCWRCGNDVEKKALKQWFFKITDYADRLAKDLDDVDWSDSIKNMQRNWIGRSTGAEIEFDVASDDNFVLLHGFTGSSRSDYFPWLKKHIEDAGQNAHVPDLPDTNKPDAKAQAAYVLENVNFDQNTVLLGYSYGSVTALRILEQLEKPIKRLVIAAGFAQPGFLDNERIFEATTDWDFDFEKIKKNVGSITILRDLSDHAVPAERADYLKEKLGGNIVDFIATEGHITGKEEPGVLANVMPSIKVFTTRPDTLYGATFMVLSPEHPLVEQITTADHKQKVNTYRKAAQTKSDVERQETNREKTGVFTGAYAINPINDEKIPVWIADYVLMGYGTGAIMAVPAHDERDFVFAKKFNLPIIPVVAETFTDPLPDAPLRPTALALGYDPNTDKYCMLDWKANPEVHGNVGLEIPGGGIQEGESVEAAAVREFAEETGYTDVSVVEILPAQYSMYFSYKFEDQVRNKHAVKSAALLTVHSLKQEESPGKEAYEADATPVWLSKDELQSADLQPMDRAVFDMLFDQKVFHGEGVMVNSGAYDGMPSDETREKIVADLTEQGVGRERVNYKMRDWLISRQRYWGAPIPMIHCTKDGVVPVPASQLPVQLPELEKFEPSGDSRSPLANDSDWVNVECPKCGGHAQRETDTMDGFACSSWYFLRFADPHNDDKPFDADKVTFWLPVDDYIGGAEHAVMHLLYARMWTKVMKDAGLIDFGEPFKTLRNHGMILAPDGQKMSKSKGNTIEPGVLIDQGYGADAIRIMELFIGPWNQAANWSVEGMGGAYRFLQRIWTLVQEYNAAENIENSGTQKDDKASPDLRKGINKTVKKVGTDIETMSFNTAIASLMELTNDLFRIKAADSYTSDAWRETLEKLVQMLAPFAPHISEELWHQLGHEDSVHVSAWPAFDDAYLVEDTVTIVVQVNGKLRGELRLPADASQEDVVTAAKADEKISSYLEDTAIRKTIYVPGRLVNFVI